MVQLPYIPLYALYTGLFLLLIFRWKFFNIVDVKKAHLAFFFLLKVAAGLALTLIYTYYYTDQSKADIYRYFNDSKIISSVLFTNPIAWLKIMSGFGTFDPGTFKYLTDTSHFSHPAADVITSNSFLIRIVSVLNYLSGYNVYIDTLLLNCITFVALVMLFKALRPYFAAFPQILYWPLFLMPSFVFWSSGLLKEGLIFIGISVYLWAWLQDHDSRSRSNLITLLLSLAVIALTKIYVVAALLICNILLPVHSVRMRAQFPRKTSLILFVLLGASAWYSFSSEVCERVIDKRNEFVKLAVAENSNSTLDATIMTADCNHMYALLPAALLNATLRPFVWDKGYAFQFLFAIENMLLMIGLLWLLVFYFKKPEGEKAWLMVFCLCFALLNYLGIGLTVPIMGAIVHYRIVAVPFLLLAVLLVTDLEKLKQRFLPLL